MYNSVLVAEVTFCFYSFCCSTVKKRYVNCSPRTGAKEEIANRLGGFALNFTGTMAGNLLLHAAPEV
jgi:hypothetical protein